MRHPGSLTYQINHLLEAFCAFGESRDQAKRTSRKPGRWVGKIHSYGNFKRIRESAIPFAKFCKARYGVVDLRDIKPEMVGTYIAERTKIRSPHTVTADMQGIKWIQYGLLKQGLICKPFIPENIKLPRRTGSPRAYTREEAAEICLGVAEEDPLVGRIIAIMLDAGLRLHEGINIRSDKINLQCATIQVKGKGGRIRTISLTDATRLTQLDLSREFPLKPLSTNSSARRKDQNLTRTVQRHVRKVCLERRIEPRGTHALRKCAAITYYERLIALGIDSVDALDQTAQFLGHGAGRYPLLGKYLGPERVKAARARH